MPAYIIVFMEVTDWERYADYTKATPSVVAQFGGRFLVRGGEIATLEGAEEKRRVVVLEFPSLDLAPRLLSFRGIPTCQAAAEWRRRRHVSPGGREQAPVDGVKCRTKFDFTRTWSSEPSARRLLGGFAA